MQLTEILLELRRCAGIDARLEPSRSVGGGRQTFRLAGGGRPLFLKVQPRDRYDLLDAEAAGLEALRAARALAVPAVVACGSTEEHAFLALEWIDFTAASPLAERRLGEGLARQHCCSSDYFGWQRDNSIGATPQSNARSPDWLAFLRTSRLAFQLRLAAENGLPDDCRAMGERLLERLDVFFAGYNPQPSLLHGDLWSGNWGANEHAVPYVFDPAVYFGDREADLAMTRLFGGFGAAFYRAYEAAWPLAAGSRTRAALYNTYHLLNHFNIFGGGYLAQLRAALRGLAAHC